MEKMSWNIFVSTGKIEDYLRYRGEDGDSELEKREKPFEGQVRNQYGRDGYRDGYGIVCDAGGRI